MIQFTIIDLTTRLIAAQLARDAIRYRRSIIGKLRRAGNVVRRQERALLRSGTRGPEEQSGRLISQHKVVVRRRKGAPVGDYEAFIGPTPRGKAFYGKFLEVGVAHRETKKGADRGILIADPWMGPAIDATRDEVEEIIGSAFQKLRIVGGIGGGGAVAFAGEG